jgi:VCBS repeat-containing protein
MGRVTITKTLQLENEEELSIQRTLGDQQYTVTARDNTGNTATVTLTGEDVGAIVKEWANWETKPAGPVQR